MLLDEPIINGDNFFLTIEDIARECINGHFELYKNCDAIFGFLYNLHQVTGNIKRNIKMLSYEFTSQLNSGLLENDFSKS